MEVGRCVSEGTHLALDFDQESEAAKNTHTYCITQGHVSSHLPRATQIRNRQGNSQQNKQQGQCRPQAHLQAECEDL